jgi:hypothetical protein
MNGLDKKTEETITRSQNARLEPANDIFDEPCPECLGWGWTLGTDTGDTFGNNCSRGCEPYCPQNKSESFALQEAHDRARLKAATAIHMKAFDKIMSAFR